MANKKPKDLEKKPTSWKFFFPRTFRKVKEPDSPNLQCPTRFERENGNKIPHWLPNQANIYISFSFNSILNQNIPPVNLFLGLFPHKIFTRGVKYLCSIVFFIFAKDA